MEMRLGYKDRAGGGAGNGAARQGMGLWPVYLCFLVFGAIVPFTRAEVKLTTALISISVALVVGWLVVNLLVMLLNAANRSLEESHQGFARDAVLNGMLFMIPFTVLAVLARFGLGWNAVMPFATAAIMTAAATAGTEVMKAGAPGIKNVMIPSFLAFVLSTGWMMLVGILP